MWAPVVERLPGPEWFGTGFKLGYIAAVRLFETALGNVFLWSGTVFYPFYVHANPRWGISALHDQVQLTGHPRTGERPDRAGRAGTEPDRGTARPPAVGLPDRRA